MSTAAIWPRTGRTAPGRQAVAGHLHRPGAGRQHHHRRVDGPRLVVHPDHPAAGGADGADLAGEEAGAGPAGGDGERPAEQRAGRARPRPRTRGRRGPPARAPARASRTSASSSTVDRQAGRLDLGGAPGQELGVVVVEAPPRACRRRGSRWRGRSPAPAPPRRPGSGPARRAPGGRRGPARAPPRRARGSRRRRWRPPRRGWPAPAPPRRGRPGPGARPPRSPAPPLRSPPRRRSWRRSLGHGQGAATDSAARAGTRRWGCGGRRPARRGRWISPAARGRRAAAPGRGAGAR